jgi:hypothetical protein
MRTRFQEQNRVYRPSEIGSKNSLPEIAPLLHRSQWIALICKTGLAGLNQRKMKMRGQVCRFQS